MRYAGNSKILFVPISQVDADAWFSCELPLVGGPYCGATRPLRSPHLHIFGDPGALAWYRPRWRMVGPYDPDPVMVFYCVDGEP